MLLDNFDNHFYNQHHYDYNHNDNNNPVTVAQLENSTHAYAADKNLG